MEFRRLVTGEETRAREAFVTMAQVFDESATDVSLEYVRGLLEREDFWAIVALENDVVVGALTAHALPMTRSEVTEMFIYDIAVREEHQRRGVGRRLMNLLFDLGTAAGINVYFVPADNEDTHALDFYRGVGGMASAVTFFTFER